MSSVTSVIKNTVQPWGGYIRPKTMMKKSNMNEQDLFRYSALCENISPSLTGTVVDYLSRLFANEGKITNKKVTEAFKISCLGFSLYDRMGYKQITKKQYKSWIKSIVDAGDLDKDIVIICACKMAYFDVWYRNPMAAVMSSFKIPSPSDTTISLIRKIVNRNLTFFKTNPITMDGFTFEGGYTDKITSGDGDFITNNTLWDMKVSVKEPTKDHSLQILIYWRMGLHSIHKEEFEKIEYLGIVNPRLGFTWTIAVKDISQETIEIIDKDIIGY